jgi:histidinol-phosphatase (PHP family)
MSRPAPLLYDTHSHTMLCHHAEGEPSEYAAQAEQAGLKGLYVTCHNPMPDGYGRFVRMAEEDLPIYLDLVRETARAWKGRVEIRLGLECDFAPGFGFEAYLERQLASAPFEYAIGSIHPQLPEYKERFDTGDPYQYQRTYFEHLALAAEARLFDCISHPDLIKNFNPNCWDLERIWPDILRMLDRVAKAKTALELNTSGKLKKIQEMNPGPAILRAMREREIPVVVGSDAHVPERVGADFQEALRLLQDAGYTEISVFKARKRESLPISDALASLSA